MKKELARIISNVRKERIIITKMVESDEKDDKLLFDTLKEKYKEIVDLTNEEVDKIMSKYSYDELFKDMSESIDEKVSNQEDAQDYVTLLGLINTNYLNKVSTELTNYESDKFSNQLNMNIYNLYLWLIKNNDYTKENIREMRNDIVMKLVNSRAFRYYFAGDYEKASDIGNQSLYYGMEDRNRLGKVYAILMNEQIELSNKFEMYDGIMDELSFNSRKEVLKMEFAAISLMLMRDGYLIPNASVDYSDFTKDVIQDASDIVNRFNNRKEDNKKKIIKL